MLLPLRAHCPLLRAAATAEHAAARAAARATACTAALPPALPHYRLRCHLRCRPCCRAAACAVARAAARAPTLLPALLPALPCAALHCPALPGCRPQCCLPALPPALPPTRPPVLTLRCPLLPALPCHRTPPTPPAIAAHCRAVLPTAAPPCLPPNRAALPTAAHVPALPAAALPVTAVVSRHPELPPVPRFDSWLEDLHLYLQSVTKDDVSLFEHKSASFKGPKTLVEPASTATKDVQKNYMADRIACTQWTVRDAVATLAVRSHLSPDQRVHFHQWPRCRRLPWHRQQFFFVLFFCTPSLLASSVASAAAVDFLGAEEVGAASALSERHNRVRARGVGVVGVVEVAEAVGGAGVAEEVGVVVVVELAGVVAPMRHLVELRLVEQQVEVAVLGVDCSSSSSRVDRRFPRCSSFVSGLLRGAPPAMVALLLVLTRVVSAEALLLFTLESGVTRYFFRDCTTVTPLSAPVPVTRTEPTSRPVVARGSTVLPCSVAPSDSLTGLHLPSFATNLTLPPILPSLALPCIPCVKGRQRFAPHSSFPPTTAPLQTLHMDVWGPARVLGSRRERYLLLVVDEFMRYTTVFPLQQKCDVLGVLIPWIRTISLHCPVSPLPLFLVPSPPEVDPLPPHPAPSGVFHVTPLPLVVPLEVSSDSSGPAKEGDLAVGDTAASRRSPRLETPPGFPPKTSSPPLQPVAVDFGGPGAVRGGDTSCAGDTCAGARGAEPEGGGGARARGVPKTGSHSVSTGGARTGGTVAFWLPSACSSLLSVSPTETREPESHASSSLSLLCRSRVCPPLAPSTHTMALRPSSVAHPGVLPLPPPPSLPDVPDPMSNRARAATPTVTRCLAPLVTDPTFLSAFVSALVAELPDFAAACRLDYLASLVSDSTCPPSVGGELALRCDVLEDRKFELEYLAAAELHLAAILLASKGDPDALGIPIPCSYANAITGRYSSQWQTAIEAEMTFSKSTGPYVNEVPPPGANVVSGMWIFRVKRPPGSPLAFKACYVARGFNHREGVNFFQTFSPTPKMTTLWVLLHIATQRDYKLRSLDFSTAFLQGNLHEKIWLRCPPGFTVSFPEGTQWSLLRLVYGLHQASREWHDTLRTTLAVLGFAPLTAEPSLFLRTHPALPPLYILVSFCASAFSSPWHSPLLYLRATRPQLHLRTSPTSGMGLVLGEHGLVVLTGHSDASWADDQATQRLPHGYTFSLDTDSVSWRSTRSSSVLSSSCEARIYAGAMAAHELRWLTCLLTDLELQQHGQLCLSYADHAAATLARESNKGQCASKANNVDLFTKALGSSDHQRCDHCTAFVAIILHVNWPCGLLLVLRLCGDLEIYPERCFLLLLTDLRFLWGCYINNLIAKKRYINSFTSLPTAILPPLSFPPSSFSPSPIFLSHHSLPFSSLFPLPNSCPHSTLCPLYPLFPFSTPCPLSSLFPFSTPCPLSSLSSLPAVSPPFPSLQLFDLSPFNALSLPLPPSLHSVPSLPAFPSLPSTPSLHSVPSLPPI
ncbi:unnamed protein product [Closterium sp. NIES-53]